MVKKLNLQQHAQIYCIKHGHASYYWPFFGYIHCGRCGGCIGDSLGGVCVLPEPFIMMQKNHDFNCPICTEVKKSLKPVDKIILERLIKQWGSEGLPNYDELLKGLGKRIK